MNIIQVPLDKIIPYARNPRVNTQSAVDKVKASIHEFGWRQPIVVDKDYIIIAGHTRYLAAKQLGLSEVPVHVAENLTPAQIQAYRITDNRSAQESKWDDELLKIELFDLKSMDYDLGLTGFDAVELGEFFGTKEQTSCDTEAEVDNADELRKKYDVVSGQLWQLGDHRLLCGDSTKAEDVKRVMQGDRCDAVLTDPPYGIGKLMQGGSWARKDDVQFEKMRDWDSKTEQSFFDSIVSLSVPSIVWGGNYFLTPPSRCWLVWDKPEFPSMASAELAWTNLDKNTKRIECPRTHQADGSKEHATQKPIAVIEWCIEFLPAGIIYDPFSGSGTTIIAGENLGRQVRAIEISPAYVAVALERFRQHTQIEPVLCA